MTAAVATRSSALHAELKTPFRPRRDDRISPLTDCLPNNEIWSLHIFPLCDEKTRRKLQSVSRSWCTQIRMYESAMPIRVQRYASSDVFRVYPSITHFTASLPNKRYRFQDLTLLRKVHTLGIAYRGPRLDVSSLKEMRFLRHLSLAGFYESISGLGCLAQLRTLNVMLCGSSIDSQLLQLKDTLQALTLFPARTPSGPLFDSGRFVSGETISEMSKLHTFGISGSSVEKDHWKPLLRAFSNCKKDAMSLMIHDDREVQNYGSLSQIAAGTTMLSLKRSNCIDFQWINMELTQFSNLSHLSFNDFNSPTATDAINIQEITIPTLRSLDVTCDIGDILIRMFHPSTLSGLERLALYAYDYRMAQIRAERLDALEYLSMKQRNTTQDGISTLTLPKLRYLELARCSDFSKFTKGPAPEFYCYALGFYSHIPIELRKWLENSTEVVAPISIEMFRTTSFSEEFSPVVADDQIAKAWHRKACEARVPDVDLLQAEDDESSFHDIESADSEESSESSSSDESDSYFSDSEDDDESSSDMEWYSPTRRKKTRLRKTQQKRPNLKRGRPRPVRVHNLWSKTHGDDLFVPTSEDSHVNSDSDDDTIRYRPRRRLRRCK